MIPDGIESKHLAKAVAEIDLHGVPDSRRSVHYDYLYSGKRYPPKYVISLAGKYAFGEELPFDAFNAVRARDYLRTRGHTVIDRRLEALQNIKDENDESAFPEGTKLFKMHQVRERDSGIAKKAKAKCMAESGTLACEVCGFDFLATYGSLGEGFIEAHHTVPVSKLNHKFKTKIGDLAMVCSNCHRMLHRQKSTLSIKKLLSILRANEPAV